MRLRLLDENFSALDDYSLLILGHHQFSRRRHLKQFRSQDFIERLPLLYGGKAQTQRFTQAMATIGRQSTEYFGRRPRHDPSGDNAAVAAPRPVEPPRYTQTAQARCWMKRFRHFHNRSLKNFEA